MICKRYNGLVPRVSHATGHYLCSCVSEDCPYISVSVQAEKTNRVQAQLTFPSPHATLVTYHSCFFKSLIPPAVAWASTRSVLAATHSSITWCKLQQAINDISEAEQGKCCRDRKSNSLKIIFEKNKTNGIAIIVRKATLTGPKGKQSQHKLNDQQLFQPGSLPDDNFEAHFTTLSS